MYDKQAKERQQVRKGKQAGATVESLPQLDSGKARDAVGKAVGVSGKSIDHATKVLALAKDVPCDKSRKRNHTLPVAIGALAGALAFDARRLARLIGGWRGNATADRAEFGPLAHEARNGAVVRWFWHTGGANAPMGDARTASMGTRLSSLPRVTDVPRRANVADFWGGALSALDLVRATVDVHRRNAATKLGIRPHVLDLWLGANAEWL